MRKSTLREIKTSLSRYLAIVAIVALGVGFYAGLQMCKPAMMDVANSFLGDHAFYDYQIYSTYGIDEESVDLARKTSGVAAAEAAIEQDVVVVYPSGDDGILKSFSLPSDINTLKLTAGRMPEAAGECVMDSNASGPDALKLGDSIRISKENTDDTLDKFADREFKIVGFVSSPLYLDYERGSSSVGSGSVDSFFYIPRDAYDLEYFTQLYIKLDGEEYIFSDELEAKLSGAEDAMKKLGEKITDARREKERAKAQEKLNEGLAEYNDGLAEFRKGEKKYNQGIAEYNSRKLEGEKKLADAQRQIDDGYAQIKAAEQEAIAAKADLLAKKDDVEKQLAETINPIKKMLLKQGLEQIEDGLEQVNAGLAAITEQKLSLDANQAELNRQKAKARKELAEGASELDAAGRQIADSRVKLRDAKTEIDDGQRQIDDMDEGEAFTLSRTDNVGYSTFEQNATIVSNIAKIFPAFFFLVAALVCMTTMTRMIEDHRSQIGTLKALGYSNRSILGKYMFYSGSAATIGSLIGFFGGSYLFPSVIWKAYTMMYDFEPHIRYMIDPLLGLGCLAVALLCSVGATWVSCSQDFGVMPAELIRPKTPRAGKRILLERITPLWNRISFLYKVSFRNVFRYKKRFLMMVVGIAGCTALLIAGMGVDTSIKGVARFQYDEITLYDYQVYFGKDMDSADRKDFVHYANRKVDDPGEITFVNSVGADIKVGNKTGEVSIISTDDPHITDQVKLHLDGREVPYPGDGEVAICRKLEHQYGIKPGDTITLKRDYKEMTAVVSGVFDNFVGETIYMNDATYEKGWGEASAKRLAYVMAPEGADVYSDAAALGSYEDASATVVNEDMLSRVDSMMSSMDAIIYVVILCAGLLAFIVLYNLTNINITERIREIATIKVLGFKQNETSSYIFRENIFLTAIGALVGLPLGKWLLGFVIDNINVNMIFFVARLTWQNYVLAVVLTFVFALIVSLAMQPVIRRISMTESLKSIE